MSKDPEKWHWPVPFVILNLGCLAVFWTGWSWTAVSMAALFYVVRMFGITGFYHRYFSHRTFRTSRVFQFLMAVVGNSAAQRGPLWWAAHHRHHHKHSDLPTDTHSPVAGTFWNSHLLWWSRTKNIATRNELITDLGKYPELRFLDRFDGLVPIVLATAVFLVGWLLGRYAPGLGTNGLQMLVWFCISTVVLFHGVATINSLSHVYGSRRFKTTDDSRNNPLLAMITLGEGWHNNHHHYMYSARNGFFWWEIDITYYGLKALSWLGLVWDLKPVPDRIKYGIAKPAAEAPAGAEAAPARRLPAAAPAEVPALALQAATPARPAAMRPRMTGLMTGLPAARPMPVDKPSRLPSAPA